MSTPRSAAILRHMHLALRRMDFSPTRRLLVVALLLGAGLAAVLIAVSLLGGRSDHGEPA